MNNPADNSKDRQAEAAVSPTDTEPTETDAEREEVIEALLEPDRSHHDELGRTVGENEPVTHGKSSPREQGAAPIDISHVDE